MIEYLNTLDITTYTWFLLPWGFLALVSFISIHYLGLMPISSRLENNMMSFMGDMNKRAAWIIMETPILITVIYFYWAGGNELNASIVLLGFFVFHYFHRALIYPYRIKVKGKTMPVGSMLSSMAFYIINGYLIGHYFGALKIYSWEWLYTPQFIIGSILFITGFYINVTSDNILINLRKEDETGYKIPYGGFYKYVSCPNYFGEILEWFGFAIMCWCLPATVYFIWVALPLIGQANQAHLWYLKKFPEEYPQDRKSVFPYVY